MNYYIYLTIGALLIIGELFSMEFSLACLGIGAFSAALVSYLGLGLWIQVISFILVAGICWLGIRPLALKHLYGKKGTHQTPVDALIGKEAIVEVTIDPTTQEGRVTIGAESWQAVASEKIEKGSICLIEKLEGVTLTVKKINKEI